MKQIANTLYTVFDTCIIYIIVLLMALLFLCIEGKCKCKCTEHREMLFAEERELCRHSQIDFYVQTSCSFTKQQRTPIHISSFSYVCRLHPDS